MNDEEREYLNEIIRGLNSQLVDALRERDEARREVCVWQGLDTGNTPRDTATVRGWDCYTRYDK